MSGSVLSPTGDCGVLRLSGADRLSFLHSYTTHEIQKLRPGEGCTTAISSWRGTVTDLVRVVVCAEDLLLIGTPGRSSVVKRALERFLIMVDVRIVDESSAWRWLEVAGSGAALLMPEARDLPLDAHIPVQLPERPAVPERSDAILVRTWGLSGEGLGLLVRAADEPPWRSLLTGRGATPVSAAAWEYRRIAAGVPKFGHDMGEDTNVWEARLDRSVSMDKGCYLGQEIVARLFNYHKVQRYLMGVSAGPANGDLTHPEPGAAICEGDREIGKLTSVAPGPDGAWIALAMVGQDHARAGQPVTVGGRPAMLEDRAFWQVAAAAGF